MTNISIREVLESDLVLFFEFQLNKESNYMAAFTSKDPTDEKAFREHWTKRLSNKDIINKTIIYEGKIVGSIAKYIMFGDSEVTYWISKEYWGKGIATKSLYLFLKELKERPLYARAVKDNIGSIRVLEKCGFTNVGEDKGFSNARQKDVEELIFKLE